MEIAYGFEAGGQIQGQHRFGAEHIGVTVHYDEFGRRSRVDGLKHHTDLSDEALRMLWFVHQSLGLDTPKEYFVEAVLDIAGADRRHPVRAFLDDLKWDGKPRTENWW